jgi:hypothetical protein
MRNAVSERIESFNGLDDVFGDLPNGFHVAEFLHQVQFFENMVIEQPKSLGTPEIREVVFLPEVIATEHHIEMLINEGVPKDNLAADDFVSGEFEVRGPSVHIILDDVAVVNRD